MGKNTKTNRPSTFGGDGFSRRNILFRQELGKIWAHCGVKCEGDPLRQVVLAEPGTEMNVVEPPNQWLMLRPINLPRLQLQAQTIADYFESESVVVHRIPSSEAKTPNWIFMRDLFWSTPEGVFLARPASWQRAGEEKIIQRFLAQNNIPQLGMPRGIELFEGADALWLNHQTILLGVGNRTNSSWKKALIGELSRGIGDFGKNLVTGSLPDDIQHLLGVINFVSPTRAAIWKGKTPNWVIEALQNGNIEPIELPNHPEMTAKRAMNWVCMGPDHVVMPHDCPNTASILNKNGVKTDLLDISEYRNAGGALGCLTGILERR